MRSNWSLFFFCFAVNSGGFDASSVSTSGVWKAAGAKSAGAGACKPCQLAPCNANAILASNENGSVL